MQAGRLKGRCGACEHETCELSDDAAVAAGVASTSRSALSAGAPRHLYVIARCACARCSGLVRCRRIVPQNATTRRVATCGCTCIVASECDGESAAGSGYARAGRRRRGVSAGGLRQPRVRVGRHHHARPQCARHFCNTCKNVTKACTCAVEEDDAPTHEPVPPAPPAPEHPRDDTGHRLQLSVTCIGVGGQRTIDVHVYDRWRMAHVKEELARASAVPATVQRLIYNGRMLADDVEVRSTGLV